MSNDFPPFGAAAQSLVFTINFAALIVLFPYNARLLNIEAERCRFSVGSL